MNSCHCSGSAESTNKHSFGEPVRMSALPFVIVTIIVLSESADLKPNVAGAVMASVVVNAFSCPSFCAALLALGRASDKAAGRSLHACAIVVLSLVVFCRLDVLGVIVTQGEQSYKYFFHQGADTGLRPNGRMSMDNVCLYFQEIGHPS